MEKKPIEWAAWARVAVGGFGVMLGFAAFNGYESWVGITGVALIAIAISVEVVGPLLKRRTNRRASLKDSAVVSVDDRRAEPTKKLPSNTLR